LGDLHGIRLISVSDVDT